MLPLSSHSVINHNQHQVLHTSRCISASPTSLLHSLQSTSTTAVPLAKLDVRLWARKARSSKADGYCWMWLSHSYCSTACAPSPPSPMVCLLSQLTEAVPQPYPPLLVGTQLMPTKQKLLCFELFFLPISLNYVIEGVVATVLFGSAAPAHQGQLRWKGFFHAPSQHSHVNET